MFRIAKTMKFDAAHRLLGHSEGCRVIHGHCWKVEVTLSGSVLNDLDMLIDFKDIKMILKSVIDRFDHSLILNGADPLVEKIGDDSNVMIITLPEGNPTAENFAKYIFEGIQNELRLTKVESVKVWETEDSWAQYDGE